MFSRLTGLLAGTTLDLQQHRLAWGFTAGPLAYSHQEDPGPRAPELAHATTLTTMSFHVRETVAQIRAQTAPKLPQVFVSNWGETGFPASQARSFWAPLLCRQFSDTLVGVTIQVPEVTATAEGTS